MPFSTPTEEKTAEQSSAQSRSLAQTAVAAGIGGATAGLLFFFSEGTKKKLQTGQKLSLSPTEILRGAKAYSTCVGTASVAQLTVNAGIKSIDGYDPNSNMHNLAAAGVSGTIGGVASTIVENNILREQLEKRGPIAAMRSLLNEGITRPLVGLGPLIAREQGFGITMLFGAPLAAKFASENWGPSWAFPAQVAFGMLGGALTHGPDTVASRMQLKQISMTEAVKSIYQENGVRGFYKGVAWRAGILFPGCAVFIPKFTEMAHQGIEKTRSMLSKCTMFAATKPAMTLNVTQESDNTASNSNVTPKRP